MTTCDCCLKAIPDGQVKSPYGLCCDCNEVWITLHDKAERGRDYVAHLLASVLCHSVKDICARKGCTPSEHRSGLTNAGRATGATRPVNVRVARWALKTGRLDKPAGFEDCNINGWMPETVSREVTVTKIHPKASPATPTAVEAAFPQPGASGPIPPSVATEPPAPIGIDLDKWSPGAPDGIHDPVVLDFETAMAAVRSAKSQVDDAFARLVAAQDAYKVAGEALLRAGRVA
jgi:hypothetical protein